MFIEASLLGYIPRRPKFNFYTTNKRQLPNIEKSELERATISGSVGTQNRGVAIMPEGHRRFRMTEKLEKAYINCGWTCCSLVCWQLDVGV